MNNPIENLIKEDLTNYTTSTKMGADRHSRGGFSKMSLPDILNQLPADNDQADTVLPHQIQTVGDRICKQADDLIDIKTSFMEAYHNPIIKDDEKSREVIKGIVKRINKLEELYKEIYLGVDKLSHGV